MYLKAAVILAGLILSNPGVQTDITHPLLIVNQTPYRLGTISVTIDFDARGGAVRRESYRRFPVDFSTIHPLRPGGIAVVPMSALIVLVVCTLDLDAYTLQGRKFSTRIDVCKQPAIWIVRAPNPPV